METKERILSLLQKHSEQMKALGVRKLGLFGSFVRGEQNEISDIDILVEFDPSKKGFDNFICLAFFSRRIIWEARRTSHA